MAATPTPHPASTAPRDGRVIRAYFLRSDGTGAEFVAVSWDGERWVNLIGEPVPEGLRLEAWGED